jgi:hypothetical protein
LGTHIPEDLIDKLLSQKVKKVRLALDADAWDKAVKYKEKYGALFGNFQLIPLSKDIKDLHNDQIMRLAYA